MADWRPSFRNHGYILPSDRTFGEFNRNDEWFGRTRWEVRPGSLDRYDDKLLERRVVCTGSIWVFLPNVARVFEAYEKRQSLLTGGCAGTWAYCAKASAACGSHFLQFSSVEAAAIRNFIQ